MIVTRGLGQAAVLGAVVCAGLAIGGAADVTITPGGGGNWNFPTPRRPHKSGDEELLLLVAAFFISGATDENIELH